MKNTLYRGFTCCDRPTHRLVKYMSDDSLRESFSGLIALATVARERNFTRAAASLGVSQSAVSHAVRSLEARLGVQLLSRNSRTVVPTELGEQLLSTVTPQLQQIDEELAALSDLRDSPSGSIRITASDHPIRTILAPKLKKLLPRYPDVKVELFADNGLVDIADKQFDAGVRLGDLVGQDMIAVRIGPDIRFTAVATKRYFANRPRPASPEDLNHHCCINFRMATHGELWAWEFEKDGREIQVRVDGQMVFNSIYDCLDAAVSGHGIAFVPEDIAEPYVKSKHLVPVLQEWCAVWPGFHLYYPSRRQPSGAMAILINALRYDPSTGD